MAKERNKAVPAVYLILREGPNVLLMRRQGSGYYDGWYSLPAGHVESNELPLEALQRETEEELGIKIQKDDLQFAHALYRTKQDETGDRFDLFFTATVWTGDVTNREPDKCDDVKWFPLTQIPDNIMHHVRDALENIAANLVYSESNLVRQNPNSETA